MLVLVGQHVAAEVKELLRRLGVALGDGGEEEGTCGEDTLAWCIANPIEHLEDISGRDLTRHHGEPVVIDAAAEGMCW